MNKNAAVIIAFGIGLICLVALPNGDAKGMFVLLLIGAFGLLVYLIPTLIANDRKHPDLSSIAAVNILLGWSLIGWVVALAWALKTTGTAQVVINNTASDAKISSPDKYRQCPFCAESILAAAIKCRYCGSEISKVDTASNADPLAETKPCPECSEMIRSGASACRHCGADFTGK